MSDERLEQIEALLAYYETPPKPGETKHYSTERVLMAGHLRWLLDELRRTQSERDHWARLASVADMKEADAYLDNAGVIYDAGPAGALALSQRVKIVIGERDKAEAELRRTREALRGLLNSPSISFGPTSAKTPEIDAARRVLEEDSHD